MRAERFFQILGFFAWLSLSAPALADDYSVASTDWNGLSRLVQIAQDEDVAIDTPRELDLSTLTPDDGLLILYPRRGLPSRGLTAYLRAGGRLAVADDFGEASDFLSIFSIERGTPPSTANTLRGNTALPIAEPALRHPLVEGVGALVTNHPTVVRHTELDAVFRYTEEGEGPVLTGAVAEGRLVVIGDPSIFINNMLSFSGNERFVRNLIRYLAGSGRLYIVASDARIVGAPGDGPSHALERLEELLQKVDSGEVPSSVTLLLSLTIVLLAIVFVAALLPRRSPYSAGVLLDAGGGGFAARVAELESSADRRTHACLTYRFELRRALSDLLPGVSLKDPRKAFRKAGLGAGESDELAALLERLDGVDDTTKVSRRELVRMVETGERVLKRLETFKR